MKEKAAFWNGASGPSKANANLEAAGDSHFCAALPWPHILSHVSGDLAFLSQIARRRAPPGKMISEISNLSCNTHGNPSALPLSLIGGSVPLDPELKKMIIVHAVGPTMSFLAIAEDHKVFDKKTEDHARTVFFGTELLKEL